MIWSYGRNYGHVTIITVIQCFITQKHILRSYEPSIRPQSVLKHRPLAGFESGTSPSEYPTKHRNFVPNFLKTFDFRKIQNFGGNETKVLLY